MFVFYAGLLCSIGTINSKSVIWLAKMFRKIHPGMRTLFKLRNTMLCFLCFICSCAENETKINLVCSGVQTIESRNRSLNYQYPTEEKELIKTFKFTLEQKTIEKNQESEKRLVWVFHTDSQPEIFDENKKIVVDLGNTKIETDLFKFVLVRKDDISVKSTYSKDESSTNKDFSSYSLNIDRVSGRFVEQVLSSSKRFTSYEVFEGSCSRSQQNRI
jgi:hypothetical protein